MQGRLYRSTKLWSFYSDLEESLGTIESTCAVYDRILDLRIATPQIVLNYALFLEVPAFSALRPSSSDFVLISHNIIRDHILCVTLDVWGPVSYAYSVL